MFSKISLKTLICYNTLIVWKRADVDHLLTTHLTLIDTNTNNAAMMSFQVKASAKYINVNEFFNT